VITHGLEDNCRLFNWIKHQQDLTKCCKLSLVVKPQDLTVYFERFERLTDEREDRQDGPRSGRPSTSRHADTIANVDEFDD
jgi:hypothetical protein